MPGEKQACPIVAACWSPAMPPIAMAPPNSSGTVVPKSDEESCTLGSIALGTRKSFKSSSSHSPVWMLNSSVRDALVASVACTAPSVSRHSR